MIPSHGAPSGQPEAAVADPDVDDVAEAEVGEPLAGGRRQVLVALDAW